MPYMLRDARGDVSKVLVEAMLASLYNLPTYPLVRAAYALMKWFGIDRGYRVWLVSSIAVVAGIIVLSGFSLIHLMSSPSMSPFQHYLAMFMVISFNAITAFSLLLTFYIAGADAREYASLLTPSPGRSTRILATLYRMLWRGVSGACDPRVASMFARIVSAYAAGEATIIEVVQGGRIEAIILYDPEASNPGVYLACNGRICRSESNELVVIMSTGRRLSCKRFWERIARDNYLLAV